MQNKISSRKKSEETLYFFSSFSLKAATSTEADNPNTSKPSKRFETIGIQAIVSTSQLIRILLLHFFSISGDSHLIHQSTKHSRGATDLWSNTNKMASNSNKRDALAAGLPSMMYGFGDVSQPDPKSVELVESMVCTCCRYLHFFVFSSALFVRW
jgi:hypothetical protein